MIPKALFQAGAWLFCAALAAQAEVRVHNLFSDHMVLQRNTSVPIWGWADDGEKVVVEFQGKKASTTAKDGRWMVRLKNLKAGGPDTLKVFGTKADANGTRHSVVEIKDVLVGEVWLASGQSNMEWPMRASYQPEEDIKKSANPHIRLFTVPKLKLNAPTNNVNARWQECEPDAVRSFSAVAYYFARDLQKALGVPVGVIHTSWGGSPAEVWMSRRVLSGNPEYQRDVLDPFAGQWERHQKALARFEADRAAAKKAGTNFTGRMPSIWTPSELYNGMIANLIPYAVQGAIWYQGESNAGRAWQYRRLFADMIENWREDWDRDFSFLHVQLAPWDKNRKRSLEEITAKPVDSDWAELREAQWLVAKNLKKTGMAVITDVGDKDDIHPTKKEPAGQRLALLARKVAYGEKLIAEGPTYRKAKFDDGAAELSFNNVGSGLEARGGSLKGFAIAGEDKKFVWADARIEGNKVIVSSPSVPEPKAVRYGWADFPVVNLFNKEGLPATPFRTDDWEMLTKPKTDAAKK
jgi:sialate O-acetylesterase